MEARPQTVRGLWSVEFLHPQCPRPHPWNPRSRCPTWWQRLCGVTEGGGEGALGQAGGPDLTLRLLKSRETAQPRSRKSGDAGSRKQEAGSRAAERCERLAWKTEEGLTRRGMWCLLEAGRGKETGSPCREGTPADALVSIQRDPFQTWDLQNFHTCVLLMLSLSQEFVPAGLGRGCVGGRAGGRERKV